MRFLLETTDCTNKPTIHIVSGATLADAVTMFIHSYPPAIKERYVVSEIKESIGEYCIAAALIEVTPPEPEQDSSKMPEGVWPDVVPAPKSIAQRMSELTISKPDPEDIPF